MKKSYYLLAMGILLCCKNKQEQTKPEIKNISEAVYASGIVKSKNQYQVYSMASGIVEKLYVKEGDYIRAGQVIMKISNQISQLSTQNSTLLVENTDTKANADRLADANSVVELAHKKLQNDSLLWVRQSNLWQQQVGTRVAFEQSELMYANAQTAYRSAVLKYHELKRQIVFVAAQSKKNLAINQTIEADYILKSEHTGRIYSLLKEQGEMVNQQMPVALIGDAQAFDVVLQIDEDDVIDVKPLQKIMLTLDSYKGEVFEAIVDSIEPLMNEKTRTFTVQASFLKKPATLYPNLTVEANIVIQTKEKVLTIPRNYLIDDAFVLNDKGETIPVKIGLKDYQKAEILTGLKASDIILKPSK